MNALTDMATSIIFFFGFAIFASSFICGFVGAKRLHENRILFGASLIGCSFLLLGLSLILLLNGRNAPSPFAGPIHDFKKPLRERLAQRQYTSPYYWTPAAPGVGRGFYQASRYLGIDRAGSSFELRLEDANEHLRHSRLSQVDGYYTDDDCGDTIKPIIARLPKSRGFFGGADLRGADLGGADLRGADLRGADLRGADLGEQWVIQGPARSDGYFFLITNLKDEGVRVKAGCRNFTLSEARKHWTETRKGTPLGDETFAILDCLEAMAKARGLKL